MDGSVDGNKASAVPSGPALCTPRVRVFSTSGNRVGDLSSPRDNGFPTFAFTGFTCATFMYNFHLQAAGEQTSNAGLPGTGWRLQVHRRKRKGKLLLACIFDHRARADAVFDVFLHYWRVATGTNVDAGMELRVIIGPSRGRAGWGARASGASPRGDAAKSFGYDPTPTAGIDIPSPARSHLRGENDVGTLGRALSDEPSAPAFIFGWGPDPHPNRPGERRGDGGTSPIFLSMTRDHRLGTHTADSDIFIIPPPPHTIRIQPRNLTRILWRCLPLMVCLGVNTSRQVHRSSVPSVGGLAKGTGGMAWRVLGVTVTHGHREVCKQTSHPFGHLNYFTTRVSGENKNLDPCAVTIVLRQVHDSKPSADSRGFVGNGSAVFDGMVVVDSCASTHKLQKYGGYKPCGVRPGPPPACGQTWRQRCSSSPIKSVNPQERGVDDVFTGPGLIERGRDRRPDGGSTPRGTPNSGGLAVAVACNDNDHNFCKADCQVCLCHSASRSLVEATTGRQRQVACSDETWASDIIINLVFKRTTTDRPTVRLSLPPVPEEDITDKADCDYN
ncbi:hypothetical protein Bbelb_033660 [Branchiostoma belcheri]|nr:hypothetical protein Bbelb_033660 [Branchiostoma belcheri]